MSFNRRAFLNKAGTFSLAGFFSALSKPAWCRNLEAALLEARDADLTELARDEDFWYYVQQSFTTPGGIINLNSGGVCPAPRPVQEAMKRFYDFSNEAPSYNMWRVLDLGRETIRRNLANLADCSPEEIAINRNASEGLETVIFGLQLKRGDEVVASKQDYPNMINAYRQREKRDGIRVSWVNLDLPKEDEDYLVKQFVNAFNPKTRLVHITHMINWNGQILPVKKIAREARSRGIRVLVDGAHSFAHLAFKIPDLECDYYAASLHKWLYAPIGSGLLYVRKDRIKELYPLFASTDDPLKEDIRKFEHLGTRPFFIEQAIGEAIRFHDMIGAERKQKRLLYLKNYWMEKVKDISKVRLNTSLHSDWSCAIGNIAVTGRKPAELDTFLMDRYKIHTVAIDWENIQGVRITPNVFTRLKDLDTLVEAIHAFCNT